MEQTLTKLKPSPFNPRVIKEKRFKTLVKSIEELPQMLDLKPFIVNDKWEILAGNMRYRACKKIGIKSVKVEMYTREIHEAEKTSKTYEEVCEEIMIKDNVSSGEWDWTTLANSWNSVKLTDWGIDVWQNTDDINYIPNYNPEAGDNTINQEEIDKIKKELEEKYKATADTNLLTICPKCYHEYEITG